MGCDIHGFWEVKDHTGNWIAVETINPQRNYMWFGLIAGVRGNSDLGTAHRGIPEDVSGAYKDMLEAQGSDLHSHTWLTPKEVQEACKMLSTLMTEAYNDPRLDPYEDVLTPGSRLHQLIVGWSDKDDNVTWPWFGSLADLMYPEGSFNDCFRMVVCFDS